MTINFFIFYDNKCAEIWDDCRYIPRIGEKVSLKKYDPLKVKNINWLGPNLIEITLDFI